MSDLRERVVYGSRWRKVRLAVLERDGWECQIRLEGCTGRAEQVDHVVPWRRGGAFHDPANLRASCRSCNVRRAGRPVRGSSRDW